MLVLLGSLFLQVAHAQERFPASRKVQVFDQAGNFIQHPFVGGFLKPQFQSIDLNGDGHEDLVVLDAANSGGAETISVFLGNGNPQRPSYTHAPAFRTLLPEHFYYWFRFEDLNGDGRKDLATHGDIYADNVRQSFSQNLFFYLDTASGDNPPAFDYHSSPFGASFIPADTNLGLQNINPPVRQDQPVIEDLDGDGDFDFLYFSASGVFLNGIYNASVEEYGTADSLLLHQRSSCWGKFRESAVSASLTAADCRFSDVEYPSNKNLHAGSGMGAIDVDGDGDLDLLLSDTGQEGFNLMINGRSDLNLPYDSMISYLDGFPQNGTRQVNLPYCPGPYQVDVDFDGDLDLIFAPYEPAGNNEFYRTQNQVWMYENTGTGSVPNYQFRTESFLQQNSLDFGLDARPLIADLDGDGRSEILISNGGDQHQTEGSSDRIALMQFQGGTDTVQYQLTSPDLLNIAGDSLSGVIPAAGDLNGDGKIDLLLGLDNGRMRFYENTTTETDDELSFARTDIGLSGFDAGTNAAPVLYDLDEDGKLDLLVGVFDGNISYYRNVGTARSASFQLITETLGQIKANPIYGGEVVNFNFLNARPTVADLDGDGTDELLVGNEYGQVLRYSMRRDSLEARWPVERVSYTNPLDSSAYPIAVGGVSMPAVGFIDADTLPDLLVGSVRGGLLLYSTNYAAPLINDTGRPPRLDQASSTIRLYPNPNPGRFTLSAGNDVFAPEGQILLRAYDAMGQKIWETQFSGNRKAIDLEMPRRAAGIYLLRLTSETGQGLGHFRLMVR